MEIEYPIEVQPKYDGIRTQVHVHEDGKIQLFSRSLKEITDQFPDIVLILQENKTQTGIFDAEIYGIKSDYSPLPFEKFQKRLGVKEVTEELLKEFPATIVIFDIIYHKNGYHNEIQFRRTQLLEQCTAYFTPSRIVDNKQELMQNFGHAIKLGYEGIMIKKMYGKYLPGEGKTSFKNWFKYKGDGKTFDVIVIGAHMGTGDRRYVYASFDIAILKEEGNNILYPIGRCGLGFDVETLESITTKAKLMNGIENVKLIMEVKSDKIMVNEKGQYHFRFPRFVKFRPDKEVSDIDTLDIIKETLR